MLAIYNKLFIIDDQNFSKFFLFFFYFWNFKWLWIDRGFEPWPDQTKDIKEKEQRLVGSESG
jgi:hypothetical protein